MIYEYDRSCFSDIFLRKDFISLVVLNVIDSVLLSFIVIKCKTKVFVIKVKILLNL